MMVIHCILKPDVANMEEPKSNERSVEEPSESMNIECSYARGLKCRFKITPS
jgi:hypothetical protein